MLHFSCSNYITSYVVLKLNATWILNYKILCNYILYSLNFSRGEIFADFVVLSLTAKILPQNFCPAKHIPYCSSQKFYP